MLVRRVVETDLPTVYGRLKRAYENIINGDVHLRDGDGRSERDEPVWLESIPKT